MAKVKQFSEFQELGVESRWFTVWEIFPGIRAIYEPYHFQEVISYLIEGEERALLFDSGMGIGNMKNLVDSLTDKPVTLVLSHSHFDHVGDAWRFKEAHLLNVPRCVKLLEEGYSMPPEDENRSDEAFWLEGKYWFDPATYAVKPCKVVPVEAGTVYDLGGRKLRVLATPGHAEDAMMLADDENQLLFTGDTVYPAPLYAHFSESSVETYRATLAALVEPYQDYTLICSHNAPIMEKGTLAEIVSAFDGVTEGKVEGENYLGHKRYDFEGFSIVM